MYIEAGKISRDDAENIRVSGGCQNIPNFGDLLFYNGRPAGAATTSCDRYGRVYDRWYAVVGTELLGPFDFDGGLAAIDLTVMLD